VENSEVPESGAGEFGGDLRDRVVADGDENVVRVAR
jgi:hypothetical protein